MNSDFHVPALDWASIDAVVFDVDGTLYDQRRLRRKMMVEMLFECAKSPRRASEVRVVAAFRRFREQDGEATAVGARTSKQELLEAAQYRQTAQRARCSVDFARRAVHEWMHLRPLRHLPACRPDGLSRLFERLASQQIKIAAFSDYPAADKLATLQLKCDAIVCSEDLEVNRLKPDPAGLQRALDLLGVLPARAFVIGDRDDRDGECARRLRCRSLILPASRAWSLGAARTYDLIFPGRVPAPATS